MAQLWRPRQECTGRNQRAQQQRTSPKSTFSPAPSTGPQLAAIANSVQTHCSEETNKQKPDFQLDLLF